MAWVETESLSFTARHDTGDVAYAERILDGLEDLRLRLEDRFDRVPGGITVVVHPGPAWLNIACPLLPVARWTAAPAGRRYMAGWAMAEELHVLGDRHMERRSAGEDSLEALRRTAERLYAQLVIAVNNHELPPPWTPRRSMRYLRWAWLIEGGAQYFSRQTGLYRAAVIRRMREGSKPSFPPGRRDAVTLGGTIFELLEAERGRDACVILASRLRRAGPRAALEGVFAASSKEIEAAWREQLSGISSPGNDLFDYEINL